MNFVNHLLSTNIICKIIIYQKKLYLICQRGGGIELKNLMILKIYVIFLKKNNLYYDIKIVIQVMFQLLLDFDQDIQNYDARLEKLLKNYIEFTPLINIY